MNKIYFLLFLLMLNATAIVPGKAQTDTVRYFVISEVMWGHWDQEFYEFTNMSETDTVNLDEFQMIQLNKSTVEQVGNEVVLKSNFQDFLEPKGNRAFAFRGKLPPGESFVVMQVQDVMRSMYQGKRHSPMHSIQLLTERADTVFHPSDGTTDPWAYFPLIPEWEMWGFDSTQVASDGVTDNTKISQNRRDFAFGLVWSPNDTTAVLVDQCFWSPDLSGNNLPSVGGVYSANSENVLVRKFNVKEGETNWILSSGDTPETSQWMMYPMNHSWNRMARETEGYHGDFHLDYSSDVYTINDAAGTITVPWGTEKNDSIRLGLTLGKGMAWDYIENPSQQDSLSTICQTGDTLVLYAFGNDVEIKKLAINVASPTNDMNRAFPRHVMNYPQPLNPDNDYDFPVVGNVPYVIEEYKNKMDSIINVPFATSIDTLMKNIDIAPNASAKIIFRYSEQTSDVKTGDKLRVTAQNGETHDYYIKCNEYAASDNVFVKSITWPDRPAGFMPGWNGDTIPNFTISGTSYTIKLPPTVSSVPALVVETVDLNARVSEKRAISLNGGIEERTTTFTITSESDTIVSNITVLFEVLNPNVQKYIGDPFFSKIQDRLYWGGGGIEICNPSDEVVDMSNYMIVQSDATNPADAILGDWVTDSTGWLQRYKKYVPGYKWQKLDSWSVKPGILEFDPAVDPFIEPKDVMVFWNYHDDPPTKSGKAGYDYMKTRVDVFFDSDAWEPGTYNNPWNEPLDQYNTMAFMIHTGGGQDKLWMFKILNDSIKQGLKPANDPADFEVVDVFGDVNDKWYIEDQQLKPEIRVTRYPQYYRGVKNLGEGLGMNSQWWMLGRKWKGVTNEERFGVWGTHNLDPITGHLSTVSSLHYKISNGYMGLQSIKGVSNNETVDEFFANLIKADPNQGLIVKGSDGNMKSANPIATGDTLLVTSADSSAITKYLISAAPLDDNAILVAKPGSGLQVDVNGQSGMIKAFETGTTIRELVNNVIVPSTAKLTVINIDNELVPLQRLNNDTVFVDVVATYNHYFEVVAENGNKIVYQLMPNVSSSDAYVISDIYRVTQKPILNISKIVMGTSVETFLKNITPAKGAKVKIVKTYGVPRVKGNLALDDMLKVTSEDGTVTVYYELTFYNQWSYFVEQAVYVTSDDVAVNQQNKTIRMVGTSVENLISYLVPSPNSTFAIYNASGTQKTSGDVEAGDMVKVVSNTGNSSATYTVSFYPTSLSSLKDEEIKVYPNPANNRIYISNIPDESTVRIYNILGVSLKILQGIDTRGGIDINDLNSGIYLISVTDEYSNQIIRKFTKE